MMYLKSFDSQGECVYLVKNRGEMFAETVSSHIEFDDNETEGILAVLDTFRSGWLVDDNGLPYKRQIAYFLLSSMRNTIVEIVQAWITPLGVRTGVKTNPSTRYDIDRAIHVVNLPTKHQHSFSTSFKDVSVCGCRLYRCDHAGCVRDVIKHTCQIEKL